MEEIRERLDHRAIADRYPVLPPDEQQALLEAVVAGREAAEVLASNGHDLKKARRLQAAIDAGEDAVRKLALHNCRLVIHNLGRFWNRGVPSDDLFQAGMIGLQEAIRRYDPDKGALSTIATWWIRQAMGRYLGDHSRTIRLPVHRGEQLWRLRKVQEALRDETGAEPSMDEIETAYEEDGNSVKYLSAAELLRLDADTISLDEPIDGSDELVFCDAIEDRDNTVDKEITGDALREVMCWAVGLLTDDRERDIIIRRFGLDGGPGETQEEIGDTYGVTRERIRQIEVRALHHLRHPRVRRRLQDFLPGRATA